MEPEQNDTLSVDVGARLRDLREMHGISMRSLAAKSSLSANALSMIERGKTSPSVSTLYKLADALGVSITTFFGEVVEKQQVIYLRSNERSRIPFSHGIFEGLGGEKFVGRVEPFVLTLEAGAKSGPHSMAHTGHEFVLCLQGKLEYIVEKKSYTMTSGDSLLFAAQLNHKWKNPGASAAKALVVLSGFADGEQPHAMHWKKGG